MLFISMSYISHLYFKDASYHCRISVIYQSSNRYVYTYIYIWISQTTKPNTWYLILWRNEQKISKVCHETVHVSLAGTKVILGTLWTILVLIKNQFLGAFFQGLEKTHTKWKKTNVWNNTCLIVSEFAHLSILRGSKWHFPNFNLIPPAALQIQCLCCCIRWIVHCLIIQRNLTLQNTFSWTICLCRIRFFRQICLCRILVFSENICLWRILFSQKNLPL